MDNLLEKPTYRIHFLTQFLQFFKKRSSTMFSSLARTISLLGLVCFNSILELLTLKAYTTILWSLHNFMDCPNPVKVICLKSHIFHQVIYSHPMILLVWTKTPSWVIQNQTL